MPLVQSQSACCRAVWSKPGKYATWFFPTSPKCSPWCWSWKIWVRMHGNGQSCLLEWWYTSFMPKQSPEWISQMLWYFSFHRRDDFKAWEGMEFTNLRLDFRNENGNCFSFLLCILEIFYVRMFCGIWIAKSESVVLTCLTVFWSSSCFSF